MQDSGLAGYSRNTLPKSDELCIVYICDALEQLGCPIRLAAPGQELERIKHLQRHECLVDVLYEVLESKAGLIERRGPTRMIRTSVSAPKVSAQSLLQELDQIAPKFASVHNLTRLAGSSLADCLVGKTDGIQVIFGTSEGRESISAFYSDSPINTTWIRQLENFFRLLIPKLPYNEPLRIMEIGAGTGGTTSKMVSLLAEMGRPVVYTMTDISSSLVAAARKRFKEYPFVDCRVIDIESEPPLELMQSYHVVLGTNCVHATRNLARSTTNILKMLRPEGILLLLELTESQVWMDLVFGLLEGWWLFDDGRTHALSDPTAWDSTLRKVGYKHVDWTEGKSPENRFQRMILALAGASRYDEDAPLCVEVPSIEQRGNADDLNTQVRSDAVDMYIQKYMADLSLHVSDTFDIEHSDRSDLANVLVTGATGSLGCHLLEHLGSLPQVETIVCLNRSSSIDANYRQEQALRLKGIALNPREPSKLRVFQSDTHNPLLGLDRQSYHFLAQNITHIIHNAWPMSMRRPITSFEPQFETMRNLIRLAVDAFACQKKPIRFQFVSSIGVVGLYSLNAGTGNPIVPEVPMSVESVLPNGYSDAKLVCERMLAAMSGRYPNLFSAAMSVRIGQIAGSRSTGYWNWDEHFAYLIKSSQTLGILPDLQGSLSWCPVDEVAASLAELILLSPKLGKYDAGHRCDVYHIENPRRQDWQQMIRWLAKALDVHQVVPLEEWLKRVREPSPTAGAEEANPAARLAEFLEKHFVRMSCGQLVLSTEKAQSVSPALRDVPTVDEVLVSKYVQAWKQVGFLQR